MVWRCIAIGIGCHRFGIFIHLGWEINLNNVDWIQAAKETHERARERSEAWHLWIIAGCLPERPLMPKQAANGTNSSNSPPTHRQGHVHDRDDFGRPSSCVRCPEYVRWITHTTGVLPLLGIGLMQAARQGLTADNAAPDWCLSVEATVCSCVGPFWV